MSFVSLILTLFVGLFILLGSIIGLNYKNNKRLTDFSISVAFGVIISLILFEILPETFEILKEEIGIFRCVVVITLLSLIGIVLLKILDLFVPHHNHEVHHHHKHNVEKCHNDHLHHIGIISSIAVIFHNLIEGMSLYIVSSSNFLSGILLCVGIGLHNIPMGLVIVSTLAASNYSKDKIMYYAAHAESLSNHPIAHCIVEAYNKPINPTVVERISEAEERGIGANIDGVEVWIGRKEFLESKGIQINKEVKKLNNFTISINGVNAGYFVFRDRIKSNAKTTIAKMKAVGVEKVVMLTGDNEEIANEVAFKTTVDSYFSEMTPLDKVDKMLELKEDLEGKGKVAFVGDGVNDTPVLSASDVGIAMGALGSDAAIEVADVVLMTDDLNNIPKAIKIAKKTKRIVIENVVLALIVKVGVLAISVIGVGWINQILMYEAIFADVGVSLLAVLNSIRAMRVDKE